MNNSNILLEKIIELKKQHMSLSFEHWISYELLRWQWWLSIVLLVVPLFVWWKLVDKKRILEIAVYGLIVNTAASFLDVIGYEFALWEYPIKVLPNLPKLFPVDFIIIPVSYMLIYQYFPDWKYFIISNTILSAFFSFIAEPLLTVVDIYRLIHWSYLYSFPIYIIISVLCRLIAEKIAKKQLKLS
ncbi:MAG: CBO0543 family protein [Bacillota bacterium]